MRDEEVQQILRGVASSNELSIDDLTGSSRSAEIVSSRNEAYMKLDQAGFGPVEIGKALNRDHSTVTRGLAEKPKYCPKCHHGPLRKDKRDGYLVCPLFCGYEEPIKELPTEKLPVEELPSGETDPGKGKYADKRAKLKGRGRGIRFPEEVKIQAVRDAESGIDKAEVCKTTGCHRVTLDGWIEKYGEKTKKAGRRVRGKAFPEEVKIQAVREFEAGGDPEEIAKRIGCSPMTISITWFYQYGGVREREAGIVVIDEVLGGLYNERSGLNKQLANLTQWISALELARRVLKEKE